MIRREVGDDGVARVHLDDPDRRNALSKELSDALAEAVATVLDAGAGAVVLTAAAPVFCSGGVLEDLVTPKAPLSEAYAGFLALAGSPVPTIAVVEGPAIGAGVNLPLACDVVVAGPDARFDPRFLDVGIHPGGGHLARLVGRVGRQGAVALTLCGDVLTGEEAVVAGLAWRCVDDPLEVALRLARRAAGRDRELVARAKSVLDTPTDDPFALELEAQQWSVDRPGFADGVRRVMDQLARRRPPNSSLARTSPLPRVHANRAGGMEVRVARTVELGAGELAAIRALLDDAFAGDFDDDDWHHTIGGDHVLVRVDGALVAHAAVVARTIHVGHRAFRAGYVEGVATAPAVQGRGHGTAAMTEIGRLIRDGFELGALGTGAWHFYERLGWERWQGRTWVRTAHGERRTEEDDDGVMVLRTGPSADIDLTAPIACEERPGDVW